MFRYNRQCSTHHPTCQRHVPTLWHFRFGEFDTVFYQEIILSSGVFRRETASGFYPWGKVGSPRKRAAEGLCGWRHGNSFPMAQNAQSHRQMRSIPHSPKAVFYVFVFLIPFTIRQQCIIYPQKFSTNFFLRTEKGGRGWSPFWIGIGMLVLLLWCALEHWWATRTATAWRWTDWTTTAAAWRRSAWARAVAMVIPSVLLGGLVAL